ncbi:MAG TPA: hypothetical protein VHL34_02720 [Rhizomicrobium sp.]|jgi:Ca2+-binding RTX toxin-like protein|nr:hypothetical protein [Rhizomicrobium sp.]
MTTTVVSASSTAAGTALDITNNNNYLILDTVDLISTGGVGIKFGAAVNGSTTTMNGFVYGDTIGIQMLSGGTNEKLFVNGDVQSAGVGMSLEAGGAYVTIGADATISGTTTGINITGGTVHLINNGTITNGNYSAGYGVQVGVVNIVEILNNGTIDGLQVQSHSMILNNYGRINTLGTSSTEDSTVNTITNYGVIAGSVGLHKGDLVYNNGTIDATIQMDGNFIKNKGVINGDLWESHGFDTITDTIVNRGTVTGDVILSNGFGSSLDSAKGHILGTITGGTAGDSVIAGSDDDTITGNDGNDNLSGRAGDDSILGGSGKDTITGGKGDDVMGGGAATDTFVFSGHFGNDIITDFAASGANHDIMKFSHNDFADYADLQAHMTQVGADVLISHGDDSVLVQNVTTASLVAGDFLFG